MKSQKGIFTKEEAIYLIMLVHNTSSSVLLIGGNSQIKRPIFLGVAACACHHSTREEETRASRVQGQPGYRGRQGTNKTKRQQQNNSIAKRTADFSLEWHYYKGDYILNHLQHWMYGERILQCPMPGSAVVWIHTVVPALTSWWTGTLPTDLWSWDSLAAVLEYRVSMGLPYISVCMAVLASFATGLR